ncbi:T9SS type A sorting domain-containing protein [Hanstruepera flava]|uniref:T9SS type A sorting domain-containing protein n=1 Tax=Hanstruepera flava TaxID=2930218 RepID=UPI002029464E|nr:T9SS type A sorting domain-containing protein [Hanstruepera flava]
MEDNNGCPYTFTLIVEEYPVTPDDSDTVQVCSGDTYTYEGQEYAAGSHDFPMEDNNGCPYTFTLIVEEYPVTPDDEASGNVCEGGDTFIYEGIEYAPGVYDIPRVDVNGCPYKTVLTVTAYPVTPDDSDTVQVCSGDTYTYEGQEYAAGSHDFPMEDNNGCPYTFTLIVEEYPVTPDDSDTVQVCSGDTYTYEGQEYAAGSHDFPMEDNNGCPYTFTLIVEEYPVTPDDSDTVQVCSGDTYTYEGQEYAAGSHDFPMEDNNGCPYTFTLIVEEYPVTPDDSDTVQVCSGDTYTYEGQEYAAGSHDFPMEDNNGCPYTFTLIVEEYPVTPDDSDTVQVCSGDTYTYEGQEYAAGSHDFPMEDNNGCPYTFTLIVEEYPVTPDDSDTVQVCSGDTYTYEGQEYAAGSHDFPMEDNNGCPYTFTLIVEEYPLPDVDAGPGAELDCAISEVQLNGSSNVVNAAYLWTTGDGNIVSGEDTLMPIVDAIGTYTLTVTDLDTNCSASDNVEVVTGPGVFDFEIVCVPKINISCPQDLPEPDISSVGVPDDGNIYIVEFIEDVYIIGEPGCGEAAIKRFYEVKGPCENVMVCEQVILIDYEAGLVAPPNGMLTVNCPEDVVTPEPPVIVDSCDVEIQAELIDTISQLEGCDGTVEYVYRYTNCDGSFVDWSFTYIIETQAPEISEASDGSAECGTGGGSSVCTYYIQLFDSLNDGWQGDTVDVLVNGSVVLEDQTLADLFGGEDPIPGENDPRPFEVATGDAVITVYHEGDYPNEVSWVITDSEGAFVAEGNASNSIEIVADCLNQTPEEVFEAWLASNGGAMVIDSCGPVTWTNDSDGLSDGCGNTGEETVTFTATDDCGNSTSTTATFRIEDTTPPEFTFVPDTANLECDADDPTDMATATDSCSDETVVVTYEDYYEHTPWTSGVFGGGNGTVDFSNLPNGFTVTGSNEGNFGVEYLTIGLTTAKNVILTFDWVYTNDGDTAQWDTLVYYLNDQLFTILGSGSEGSDSFSIELSAGDRFGLGIYNPSDDCCGPGVVEVSNINWEINNECPVTKCFIREFTATDACGNTSTARQNVVFRDTVAPIISTDDENADLGCNPEITEPTFTATDNCGEVEPIVTTEGPVATGDCGYSQTWTANVEDACGNQAESVSITYTWTEDNESPVIVSDIQSGDLGCNPDIIMAPVFTANDNCSVGEVSVSTNGPEATDGCGMSQTWTANVSDACGNPADEVSITLTWTLDSELPVITSNSQNADLGCNPEIVVPLFKVEDNCLATEMDLEPTTEGPQSTDGCGMTQTWTATYTDNCGNEAIPLSVTYNWIVDTEVPIILTINESQDLGCNPDVIEAPQFKVYDNCLDSQMQLEPETNGPEATEGCGMSQTWTATYTDACGNQAEPVSITYTWVLDNEAPVISTNGNSGDLGCNPEIEIPLFKADDNCSGEWIPLEPYTEGPTSTKGCGMTQTWTATYTDPCGNEAIPVSVTYTWTVDNEIPIITTNGNSADLGCNPEIVVPLFKAEDNCSEDWIPLQPYTDGPVSINGCEYSQTWTATYTDPCGNEAIPVSVTYTWMMEGESVNTNQVEAFARTEGDNGVCFIPEFSRWGWSNYISEEKEKPYELKLYANSNECRPDYAAEAGKVEVFYNNGTATVVYTMYDGYVLNSSSTYVGCQEFPLLSNGRETVSPERYNFISPDVGDFNTYTVGPIDVPGAFYVIACARVSEIGCSCSGSDETVNGLFATEGSAQCRGRIGGTLSSGFSFRAYQGQDTEELNVNFELDIDSRVTVDVMNMNGILLQSQVINNYVKGTDETMLIDTSKIRDRVLFVRITTNQGSEIKKIILNRK